MGLADTLMYMKIRYDSEEALNFARMLYEQIALNAYDESVELARQFGPFPMFGEAYLDGPFISRLPSPVKRRIEQYGIRNACLLSQAPTGTISMLMGVSSGIEPVYDKVYRRRDGIGEQVVVHPLYADHRTRPYFVTAKRMDAQWHLRMQERVQYYVDQSVSKTINLPRKASVEDVYNIYLYAITHGFKGITVFRDGCRRGVMESMHCETCGTILEPRDGCFYCPSCGGGVCSL